MPSSGAPAAAAETGPSPGDGAQALRGHVVVAAARAREALGPIDDSNLFIVLQDARLTRYPVSLRFDSDSLRVGELGFVEPVGDDPADGWLVSVHPALQDWANAATEVAVYQLVVVIYGELAEAEHAELFGSTLLGLEREKYYRRLCHYADRIWWQVERT